MRSRILVALTLIAAAGSASAGPKEDRRSYRALLAGVEARHGVHHRSLVVIPIVLKIDVERTPAPLLGRKGLTWSVVGDRSRSDTVSLTLAAPKDGDPPPPVIMPAGLLLAGDGRERLLSRSVLLRPGEEVRVRARFCDAIEKPLPEPPVTEYRFHDLGPSEQRRFDLLHEDSAALLDIRRIQGILAGLPEESRTVLDVMRAPTLKARVEAATAALGPVAGAYGGATVGHLAMIGHRPVEVMLAASPESYRSLAAGALRALAVGYALWEEFYGKTGSGSAAPDWAKILPVARASLTALSDRTIQLGPWRLGRREKGGARTLLVQGPKPHRSQDDRSRLIGRLLLGDKGRGLLLDVYPSGAHRPFPPPLIEPGGRSSDDRPDVRDGTSTMEFLRRFMRRLERRRAAAGR